MNKTLLLIFTIAYVSIYSQINLGLKAYFPFNGNTNDISGNNHNGQINGSVILVADRFGSPNSAFQFPGNSTSYISINYSADFNIAPTDSFSISLWYKGGSPSSGDFEVIFGKENPTLSYKPYDYYLGLYDGNRVLSGGNGNEVLWSPISPTLSDPNWHHVVLIYENKNWYLYQDNVLTVSKTNSVNISQSNNGLVIGKSFQGNIDDVRFYNRKLSVSEIDTLFKLDNLSVTENSKNDDIKIFPNPTSNILNINRKNKEPIKVFIYDMSGKLVYKNNFSSKEINIDVSKFIKGIYNVNLVTNNIIKSKSIIKID